MDSRSHALENGSMLGGLAALMAGILTGPAVAANAPPADLVLRAGIVVTVDEGQPRAQALAARGERLIAVGSDAEVQPLIGPQTRVIDLGGRLAVPGFIEGPGHLTSLGEARQELDLTGARDWPEVVERVANRARQVPPGEWIVGSGWHQGRWERSPEPAVEGYPVHAALSRLTPDNPVLLRHATGHMCFAN